VFGVQTPVQAPLTHAEDTHVVVVPHCPLAEQISIPLFEHCVAPGAHVPVQTPPTHAWFVHAEPFCQDPLESHVWTTCPLHCFAVGVHVPEHAPPLQTLVHTVPFTQVPV
jgi:hypothetical protein